MTLSTLIKFVGAGNGGTGGGSEATSAATAGVATGDILMMIAGIVLAVAGVCAVVFASRYATATSGAHGQTSSKISAPIIAAFAAILLGLTLSVVGATQMKAHADTSDPLQTSGDIIATVDEQTGTTEFAEVTITNTSEYAQNVSSFALSAAEGVDVSEVTWKITVGDTVVFNNKIGETSSFAPFNIDASSSVAMRVETIGLASDLAKSLINKEVATGTTNYEKCYKVAIAVDDKAKGSVDIPFVNCVYGTEYSSNLNVLTVGSTTITATPNATYAFDSWDPESGTITDNTTITAKFKLAELEKKSLKVTVGENEVHYYPVFSDESLSDDFKFYSSTDGTTFTPITPSAESGKYKMSDLTASKDILYYTNSGTSILTCVSSINEEFDKAFAAQDGSSKAATSIDDNKAYKYKGNFADKNNAVCVPLSTDWYCENDEGTVSEKGKYGPGKDFSFSEQSSTTEPKISGVGINAINTAYTLNYFSQEMGGVFWSSVSCAPHLDYAWVWTTSDGGEWNDSAPREGFPDLAVLFTRTFN